MPESIEREPAPIAVTIHLSPVVAGLLLTLAGPELTDPKDTPERRIEAVILELIDHAQQGVYRPGAWERQWLTNAFGEAFIERLEPGCPYGGEGCEHIFQKPKKA